MKSSLWQSLIPKLVADFRAAGIESCELGFSGCTGRAFTGFAHAYKRRNVPQGKEDEVILACTNCHRIIEYRMPEAEMTRVVLETIARRPFQPGHRSCLVEPSALEAARARLNRLFEATFQPHERPRKDWQLLCEALDTLPADLTRQAA